MTTTANHTGSLIRAISAEAEAETDANHIVLADLDAWDAFVDDNREAIEGEYGSAGNAYRHAVQGGLTLGGGAAPLFTISFAD